MPPPPSPPELPPILKGDIDEIRAPETGEYELPEMPPALPAPEPVEIPQFMRPSPMVRPAEEEEVKVFDRTITPEEPEIKEIVRPEPKPTFVAIEDYKRVINDTNTIRSKLMDAENFVRRLSDLKNEEERAFEKWRTQLENVEKKLNYVDKLIARAQK